MTRDQDKIDAAVALRYRLQQAKAEYGANANIAAHMLPGDREAVQHLVELHMESLLEALCIDIDTDHNTKDTAKRVAKMFVQETFAGRYEPMPAVTAFPNAKQLDEIYTLGPIAVRSTCSHHFQPISGKLWVGVIPTQQVIGISKFVRLARWIMARPQIQEEATVQLADLLTDQLAPKGLAVVVKATHHCMTQRGVCEHDSVMATSVMRGAFMDNPAARAEFLKLIEG